MFFWKLPIGSRINGRDGAKGVLIVGWHCRGTRDHKDCVAVALLCVLPVVEYTCLIAFQVQGLCSLPVHESIAKTNARDGAVTLACDSPDEPAQNQHKTRPHAYPRYDLSLFRLAYSAACCASARGSARVVRFSSRHIVSPAASVVVSASFLLPQKTFHPFTQYLLTTIHITAINHPTWRHHVSPPVHMLDNSADKP
jgi:hypothetical protein